MSFNGPIQVAHSSVTVVAHPALDGDEDGSYNPTNQTILLLPTLSEDTRKDCLAHEIEHAIAWHVGFRDNDKKYTEEDFVERLTSLRLDTYRRNPALREYLFGS